MRPFQVRWQGFRSFVDTDWLEIRPFTLLIGANNSGKTSLLAPLLLLKQTLSSKAPNAALISRGPLFNAGWYDDLIYRHESRRELTLTLCFRTATSEASQLEPVGRYPPGRCELTFTPGSDANVIQLERYDVYDIHDRLILRRRRMESGRFALKGPTESSLHKHGASEDTEADRLLRRAIERAYPDHFLFTGPPVLRATLQSSELQRARVTKLGIPPFAVLYLAAVEYVATEVRRLLDDISYIGPLRERPRRLYEISGHMPADVGTGGQYAPEIIYRHKSRQFRDQIKKWLNRFDLPDDIECDPVGEGAFSVKLRRERGPWFSLADLGFGASQVLPLMVQGFFGGKDSILLAEQPEIHLNPRLQAELADLFSAIANSGRGVLIETHSEHLLLRLRRLIAEGVISADHVALYYVERAQTASVVRRIPIRPDGHIDEKEWPAGFFEDSLNDALDLAAWQAKRHADVE